MFGSVLAGQAGPSMQGVASARGAAYHVYELINRVSTYNVMLYLGSLQVLFMSLTITLLFVNIL